MLTMLTVVKGENICNVNDDEGSNNELAADDLVEMAVCSSYTCLATLCSSYFESYNSIQYIVQQ